MSEGLHRVEYFLKEMCAWQEAADVEAARHRIDRDEKEIKRLRAALRRIAVIDDSYSETYVDLRKVGSIAREALGDEG